uniref:CPG4 domain-containing protein n=1 Tax=Strongyloides stercoralis TaxID=6248 RepID=A0A0K0EN84_STRER
MELNIIVIFITIFNIYNFLINGIYAFPGNDCVEPCMLQMQLVMQNGPFSEGEMHDNKDHISWNQLLHLSKKKHITEQSFHDICQAYRSVDKCLQNCESISENSSRLRKTYAGIRFICIDHKKEFFTHLPCLAENEPLAMSECKNEINQSLISSSSFGEAIINREQHLIRNRFNGLCQDLKQMIRCIRPVTIKSCGKDAAEIMMKFITIGFTSFEQLYSQLGLSDHLPIACKNLVVTTQTKIEEKEEIKNIQSNDNIKTYQRQQEHIKIISSKSNKNTHIIILILTTVAINEIFIRFFL